MKKAKLYALLFTAIVIITAAASFAWFMNLENVQIESDNNMSITVGTTLEIREHGTELWGQKLTFSRKMLLVDCSGNGVDFYAPLNLDNTDQPSSMFKLTNFDGYIIDTYIDVRSKSKMELYLGSNSRIYPTEPTEENPNINESLYDGVESLGAIAGCVRVAFFEVTYDERDNPVIGEPICVWAPNSKYELTMAGMDSSVKTDGVREPSYGYYIGYNRDSIRSYSVDDCLAGKFSIAEKEALCFSTDTGIMANAAPKLLTFEQEGVVQEKHMLIRIWFEGTDREARYVLNNGIVDYDFEFVGMPEKSAPSDENTAKLDALTLAENGEGYSFGDYDSTLFIYSLDGLTWTTLGSGKQFTADDYKNGIYVKLKETYTTKESAHRTFKLNEQIP